jgi:HK97 family phage portal protein
VAKELTVFRAVAAAATTKRASLSPISENRGAWSPWIREPYAGAWQQNAELTIDVQLAFSAVYACITQIQNDMGKMRPKLVERSGGPGKVWKEVSSPSFSPFLRRPNRFQNHIQFKQWWAGSKLSHGNTYALKERDGRGIVVAQYILDPRKTLPLVTPDGEVYYQLGIDNLAGLQTDGIVVPASEIIHDRMNCLFHPLVGISPLFACGLAAAQGLAIQNQSRTFFGNGARPSGVLTAPGTIQQTTADRLKAGWEEKFSGANAGRVAILGDGLKYEPMTMTAEDSQLIEQLRFSAETVCAAFHVPPWKIGLGTMPTYTNGELLNQQYYSDCLQSHIEEFELCQDMGLGIGEGVLVEGRELGVELDLKTLLRMDSASLHEMLRADIAGSLISINDGRLEIDLEPVPGGDTIWMQQQNYSLDALVKRDKNDPFAAPPAPTTPPQPATAPPPEPAKAIDLEPITARMDAIERGLGTLLDAEPLDLPTVIREALDTKSEDDMAAKFVASLAQRFSEATEE